MRLASWAGTGILGAVWMLAALSGWAAGVDGSPRAADGAAASADPTVWVLSRADRSITVIDAGTGSRVARVNLGFRSDPGDLVHWDGSVWVGNSGGSLQQVDVATRRVAATIPLEMDVWTVDAAPHGIYGVDGERSLVSRHDPASGEVTAILDLPDRIHAAGAGPETALVVVGDRQEAHVFPAGSTRPTVFGAALGPGELRYGFGSLWLYQLDQRLLRLDPASGSVVAEIPDTNVDEWAAGPGRGLSVGEERVWIVSLETGEALGVDPASNRVTHRISVGGHPEHAVEVDGQLWVVLPQEDAVVRFDVATGEETARVTVDFPVRIIAVR